MDPIIGAGLISAASNILGGRSSDRSARRAANAANAQIAADNAADRAMQREFAQHGLRWRVDDARAARLHPLAALGAQLSPASPVGSGGQTYTGSSKGDAIRAAGAALAESVARAGKEKAETRLLNAQADFTEQQARDSQVARIAQTQVNDVVEDGFHEVHKPQRTSRLRVAGVPISTSRFGSDGQTYEDRYGEVAGSVLGATNVPIDMLQTLYELAERLGSHRSSYIPESIYNIK